MPRGSSCGHGRAAWKCADPGIQYDTTINPVAHAPEHGPHQRLEPMLGVHVARRLGVQPRVDQPVKYRREDGDLDVEAFEHAVDVMFLAQEILVGYSSYPTPEIERNAKASRQLGLGYANLGALLMARGLPYDSDDGRAYAAAIPRDDRPRYRKSAEIAGRIGAYAGHRPNAAAMISVMAQHRAAVGNIENTDSVPADLLSACRRAWDEALNLGEVHGYRNRRRPSRADRDDQLHDGLRHDRGRARLLARQVEEARRRRRVTIVDRP